MRRVIVMGAGGRDFHDFNVVFRDDPETRVVAFTAAQIPGIAGRRYPASLAGPLYPDGIPIRPEEELAALIREEQVDEVVFSYSDLSHAEVMHTASAVLAAGADFRLLGPERTMLQGTKPVVAVCAVRTGSGKSQTSRHVGRLLRASGLRVVLVRHPMPYGELERMRVQRFASLADIDAARPTIEEREEYEASVEAGLVVYAGVDYAEILERAQEEADLIVWDGGNNDLPFFRPDLLIVVVDPLRAGHELSYHPGEANLRLADVVVVNKVDSADPAQVERVLADVASINPAASIVKARSPVTLEHGPSLVGAAVLVVEDGPTITHGGMPFGAGLVATQRGGAGAIVDPRPYAVGSIGETYERYPHIGSVLPAMGYSDEQLRELEQTMNAIDCDVVVSATPIDLGRLVDCRHPIRHATYELEEIGRPTLSELLAPIVARAPTVGAPR
ncbi:MAG TPA: cyclic 2,3-diphosphoglycerate synthase [Gaiellaceae bacterium]